MNQLYDNARERFLTGQLNWLTMTWFAWLVNPYYVYNSLHLTIDDVPAHARMQRSLGPLEGKLALDGWADADAIVFGRVMPAPPYVPPLPQTPAVVDPCSALLLTLDTGMLLWYGDTGFNLPFVPDGSEVLVFPDAAMGGFFRL